MIVWMDSESTYYPLILDLVPSFPHMNMYLTTTYKERTRRFYLICNRQEQMDREHPIALSCIAGTHTRQSIGDRNEKIFIYLFNCELSKVT